MDLKCTYCDGIVQEVVAKYWIEGNNINSLDNKFSKIHRALLKTPAGENRKAGIQHVYGSYLVFCGKCADSVKDKLE